MKKLLIIASLFASHVYAKYKCPDNSTEFVIGSPMYKDHSASIDDHINIIKKSQMQYKTLLNEAANKKNYLDHMQCPRLKGFINISHGNGNGSGILLHNSEELKAADIEKYVKFKQNTVIIAMNSCNSWSIENNKSLLQNAFLNAANASNYIGINRKFGIYKNKRISQDIEASKLLWMKILKQKSRSSIKKSLEAAKKNFHPVGDEPKGFGFMTNVENETRKIELPNYIKIRDEL